MFMRRKSKNRFFTIILSAALLVLSVETAVIAAPEQSLQEKEEILSVRMNNAIEGLTMPDLSVDLKSTEMTTFENTEKVKSNECAYFLNLDDKSASRVPMRTEGNEIIAYGDVVTTTLGNTLLLSAENEVGSVDYCINGNMYKGISGDTWLVAGRIPGQFTYDDSFTFELKLEDFTCDDELMTNDPIQQKTKYFDKIVIGDGSAVLECKNIENLEKCLTGKHLLSDETLTNTIQECGDLKETKWNAWRPDSLQVQYTFDTFSDNGISTVSAAYDEFRSRLEEIAREEEEKANSTRMVPEDTPDKFDANIGQFKVIDGVIFWYNSATGEWISEEDLEYGFEFGLGYVF